MQNVPRRFLLYPKLGRPCPMPGWFILLYWYPKLDGVFMPGVNVLVHFGLNGVKRMHEIPSRMGVYDSRIDCAVASMRPRSLLFAGSQHYFPDRWNYRRQMLSRICLFIDCNNSDSQRQHDGVRGTARLLLLTRKQPRNRLRTRYI